jgi:hypothetical protein
MAWLNGECGETGREQGVAESFEHSNSLNSSLFLDRMKHMLTHSFVLDCLEDTGADTFAHFEMLIEEHRLVQDENSGRPSRLKQLVPTVGVFHTPLPLKKVRSNLGRCVGAPYECPYF